MAAIANYRDTLLQAAAVRFVTAALVGFTVDFSNVNGGTKPSNNADVTTAILGASGTSVTMTSSTLLKSSSGLGGVFLGAGGLLGKDSGGNTTFSINATTGAVAVTGAISGGSTIDITGSARLRGARSVTSNAGTITYAVTANESAGSQAGVYGQGSVMGVLGQATGGSGSYGVYGDAGTGGPGNVGVVGDAQSASGGAGVEGRSGNGGYGVNGTTAWATGAGVRAFNNSGNVALRVEGQVTIDNSSVTWNSRTAAAPAGSSTTVLHNDMVWRDPVTTARVNAAFGVSQTGVVQTVVGDTGTATAAGAGLNLTFGTGLGGTYQVRGTGNSLVMESVSDIRLKQDVEDETLGIAFIDALRPVSFRMKANPAVRHHGFIAQEMALVAPADDALFQRHDDGIQGIDYIAIIAPLVKAVQQLHARVGEFESSNP